MSKISSCLATALSMVNIIAARLCRTGVASSERYSFSYLAESSCGISSIHIPTSYEKYRVVKLMEWVRPACDVEFSFRPSGRDEVKALTRESFPDLG